MSDETNSSSQAREEAGACTSALTLMTTSVPDTHPVRAESESAYVGYHHKLIEVSY